MTHPPVPTEIVEAIVDQLHDDKLALHACSLVSWAWLPRSRFRLFKSLIFHAKPDGSGFIPFLEFLRSSPGIAQYIRELRLNGIIKVPVYGEEFEENEIISYSTFFDILDSLPSLSALDLRSLWLPLPIAWTEEEHDRFRRGPTSDINLRKLTLCSIGHVTRYSLETTEFEFRSILSSFSSVEKLEIGRFPNSFSNSTHRFCAIPRDLLYRQTGPLSLTVRESMHSEGFWDTIFHIPIPIKSLIMHGWALVHLKKVKDYTSELEHLGLHCSAYLSCGYCLMSIGIQLKMNINLTPVIAPSLHVQSLSLCGALTSFTLSAEMGTRDYSAQRLVDDIATFLRDMPPSIQKMKFLLCCRWRGSASCMELMDQVEWTNLGREFDRLPKLTKVVFLARYIDHPDSVPPILDDQSLNNRLQDIVKRGLSPLYDRGILSIQKSHVTRQRS